MNDSLKQLNYKRKNGTLEVTLRDETFQPIYKGEAKCADKKDMYRLMDELTMKGLSFPKNWWKFNAFNKGK
jgi:hypothetical protein